MRLTQVILLTTLLAFNAKSFGQVFTDQNPYSSSLLQTKANPIKLKLRDLSIFTNLTITSKVYKNGKYLVTRLSNYDAYNDEIVISDEKNEKFFMTKNEELTTVIGADKFVYFSLLGYFMVLNEGEVLLLKKPIKKFVEATPAKTGYDTGNKAHFIDEVKYYIITPKKKTPKEIKLKKKDLLNNLDNDHKKSMEVYLEKNKNSLRKEEDFIQALNAIKSY